MAKYMAEYWNSEHGLLMVYRFDAIDRQKAIQIAGAENVPDTTTINLYSFTKDYCPIFETNLLTEHDT